MSTLKDNDLMLIERDGVQYKVESQYVNVGPDGTITSPVEVLTPVDGDGLIVGTQDAVISSAITAVDGNTITFASDVSSSLKAPISMVDANGNPVAPTTSNVTTTTTIPGTSVVTNYDFEYPYGTTIGYPQLINSAANMYPGNSMPIGDRMLWIKTNNNSDNAISDSVALNGRVLFTNATDNSQLFSGGVEFGAGFTRLPYDIESLGTEVGSGKAYATEIGVSPGLLDIVTWSGTGTASTDRRIPHSLGSVPGMIIVKRIDGVQDWYVFHTYKGVQHYANLNNSNRWTWTPAATPAWGAAPTTTDFGINENTLSTQTGEYVAYVFAEDTPGKIKCGTYTGNGGDNFVDVGFQPNFVLLKEAHDSGGLTNNGRNWLAVNTFMMGQQRFWRPSDKTHLDGSGSEYINNNSTSIHIKGGSNSDHLNKPGSTYIYLAVSGADPTIGGPVLSPDTTQLTFQDDTNLDQLTSGMTITSNGPGQSIDLFSTTLYQSGSGDQKTITTGIDNTDKSLVWIKGRNLGYHHKLMDSERGSSYPALSSDLPDPQSGDAGITQLTSNGFVLAGGGYDKTNDNNNTQYVAWNFRAEPGFFDIQTWTGNNVAGRTIPHNLGTAPGMILVKRLNDSDNWVVYNKGLGATHPIVLNANYAAEPITNRWNDTEPTSTEFTVGTWPTNDDGIEYIAYIFADNPSNEIKCGSYTGTGADNNNIECGFESAWVMIKNADEAGGSNNDKSDWYISDNQRGFSSSWGQHGKSLSANDSDAEISDANIVVSATGFKPATSGAEYNKSGINYIYVAIGSPSGVGSPLTAELTADADPSTNTAIVNESSWPTGDSVTGPAITATASVISSSYSVPAFATTLYSYTSTPQTITNGIDLAGDGGLVWTKWRSGGAYSTESHCLIDTERSSGSSTDQYGTFTPYLKTDSSNTQTNGNLINFNSDGYEITSPSSLLNHTSGGDYVSWTFGKAAGFFDIVTYDGDSNSGREIPHNLGSIPGMIIVKCTQDDGTDGATTNWVVHHKSLPNTELLKLNTTDGSVTSNLFYNTTPTDQVFTVGSGLWVNSSLGNRSYVAYLFADNSSNGIKCGSYLGNATGGGAPAVPNQIECGFRPAWVLIKNTEHNDTGWYILDAERGANYLTANTNDSEGTFNPAGVVFNDTGFSLPTGHHFVNQDNVKHIFVAISADAGEFFNLASNQLAISGTTTGTFQVGQNVKGSDYIYEIASQSSAITAVNDGIVTFADQDGLVQMTAPVSTETGTATGFITGSYSAPAFSTTTYTGTGSTMSISTGIDLSTKGLLWFKGRGGSGFSDTSHFHFLFDSERNNYGSYLITADLDRQGDFASYGWSPQPAADGTISNLRANLIHSNIDWVAWAFRAAPGFFDIVTYSGTGSVQNISHSLGSAPGMMIVKRTDASAVWAVYHKDVGVASYMMLNSTGGTYGGGGHWDNTAPTSSVFTVRTDPDVNQNGGNYVAYLFADNPSNGIKCGSYQGTDYSGTVQVDCGFEPQWVMIKSKTYADRWRIYWNTSSTPGSTSLAANVNSAEDGGGAVSHISFTSSGFTVENSAGYAPNSADAYVFMAIGVNNGENVDLETNQALLQGINGTFSVGQTVTGSAQVADHPLTSEIEFKSVNGASGTGEFNGTDCTLNARIWTLETASDVNGPWTVVDTYVDTDANASQDGATPWTTGTPTLQPNTIYRVKVQYQTADSAPVESTYHTFKTGAS